MPYCRSSSKIVEQERKSIPPNTQIHESSHSWISTNTSINSGEVILKHQDKKDQNIVEHVQISLI